MTISDETLMAYVDGELEPSVRDEVDRALRTDPELAARAARYRDLRARLESAYAPELAEPIPERLLAVLRAPPRAAVTDLSEARAARQSAPIRRGGPRWTGMRLTSIAAGMLLAVSTGWFVWRESQPLTIRTADGALVASGALARSLSSQLAGDSPSSSKVTIGLSFRREVRELLPHVLDRAGCGGLRPRVPRQRRVADWSSVAAAKRPAHAKGRSTGRRARVCRPPCSLQFKRRSRESLSIGRLRSWRASTAGARTDKGNYASSRENRRCYGRSGSREAHPNARVISCAAFRGVIILRSSGRVIRPCHRSVRDQPSRASSRPC